MDEVAPTDRIDPRRALLGGAICWAGFALVCRAMLAGWFDAVDRALLEAARTGPAFLTLAAPWLLETTRDVTALGGQTLRNAAVLLAIAFLVALRRPRLASWLFATVASGLVVSTSLKLGVGRIRPDAVPMLMEAGGFAFPSGHTFNGTLCWSAIVLAFAPLIARQPVRIALLAAALLLGALIGASRVLLGVHFPSDVLAGWLGGAGWAFLAAAWLGQGAGGPSQRVPGSGTKNRSPPGPP